MLVRRTLELRWYAVVFPLIFLSLGLALLPYPGLQHDEVLFTNAYFGTSGSAIYSVHVLNQDVPLMLLSYLGATKTWLFAMILGHFPPSFAVIRVPTLILGAVVVVLFTILVETAHSRRAAIVGGLLLATDSMFLLTTCFDWGPVALQHFFLIAGMLLVFRSRYFWGFLFFGLGMWDKALFTWMLAGLAIATVCVFRRELWLRFTLRNVSLAAAGFCLGALPLIVYNAASGLATFRSNSSFSFDDFRIKARSLQTTWNGSALFGYIANNPDAGSPRPAETTLERASFALHSAVGDHRQNWLEAAFLVGLLLLVPLVWWKRARLPLFCLIAIAVAWLLMALTKGAGIAAHHAVLLWPIPHLFLGVVFAEASLRWRKAGTWLLTAGVLALAAGNLLVTNQYLYQLNRYGGAGSWTDAIYPLSQVVAHLPAEHVVIDDWGIFSPLQYLHGAKLPMVLAGNEFLLPAASETQKTWDRGLMERGLWLGHTPPYEQFQGSTERIATRASVAGYRKILLQVVADRNGRPVFEVFRFMRTAANAP
jgi:hypothetical protein